jgi:Ca2+-binding RTX toxin-like protein
MPRKVIVKPKGKHPVNQDPDYVPNAPYNKYEVSFSLPATFVPIKITTGATNADANYWDFELAELAPGELGGITGGITGITVQRLNSGSAGLQVTLSISPNSTQRQISLDAFSTFNSNIINFEDGSVAKRIYSGETSLIGGGKSDFLYGGDGNETIDGRGDADYMNGGGGNDTYVVDNNDDLIDEKPQTGIETVRSSVTWSLKSTNALFQPTGIDHLVLTGNANIDGTGNYLSNDITGNAGNNVLIGFGTTDGLSFALPEQQENARQASLKQVDRLKGGGGRDIFVIGDKEIDYYTLNQNGDYALINGFTPGVDKIQVKGDSNNYLLTNQGNDVWIYARGTNDLIAKVNGDELGNRSQQDRISTVINALVPPLQT